MARQRAGRAARERRARTAGVRRGARPAADGHSADHAPETRRAHGPPAAPRGLEPVGDAVDRLLGHRAPEARQERRRHRVAVHDGAHRDPVADRRAPRVRQHQFERLLALVMAVVVDDDVHHLPRLARTEVQQPAVRPVVRPRQPRQRRPRLRIPRLRMHPHRLLRGRRQPDREGHHAGVLALGHRHVVHREHGPRVSRRGPARRFKFRQRLGGPQPQRAAVAVLGRVRPRLRRGQPVGRALRRRRTLRRRPSLRRRRAQPLQRHVQCVPFSLTGGRIPRALPDIRDQRPVVLRRRRDIGPRQGGACWKIGAAPLRCAAALNNTARAEPARGDVEDGVIVTHRRGGTDFIVAQRVARTGSHHHMHRAMVLVDLVVHGGDGEGLGVPATRDRDRDVAQVARRDEVAATLRDVHGDDEGGSQRWGREAEADRPALCHRAGSGAFNADSRKSVESLRRGVGRQAGEQGQAEQSGGQGGAEAAQPARPCGNAQWPARADRRRGPAIVRARSPVFRHRLRFHGNGDCGHEFQPRHVSSPSMRGIPRGIPRLQIRTVRLSRPGSFLFRRPPAAASRRSEKRSAAGRRAHGRLRGVRFGIWRPICLCIGRGRAQAPDPKRPESAGAAAAMALGGGTAGDGAKMRLANQPVSEQARCA